jgi:hypothetical protein
MDKTILYIYIYIYIYDRDFILFHRMVYTILHKKLRVFKNPASSINVVPNLFYIADNA